jgi:hypothetical protein
MSHNFGQRLCRTSDGGFVLGGAVWGDPLAGEVWLVKTNANGDVQWTQTMTGSTYRRINDVTATRDGGCVVSTYDDSGSLLTKWSSSGNQVWSLPMSSGVWSWSTVACIVQSPDGGFLAVGSCYPNGTTHGSMPFMLRTTPDSPEGVTISQSSLPQSMVLQPCYPNPFNSATRISFALPVAGDVSLQVFDMTGRSVTTLTSGAHSAGQHTILFDGHDLASGTYFCQLRAGNFQQTQKMILLR